MLKECNCCMSCAGCTNAVCLESQEQNTVCCATGIAQMVFQIDKSNTGATVKNVQSVHVMFHQDC